MGISTNSLLTLVTLDLRSRGFPRLRVAPAENAANELTQPSPQSVEDAPSCTMHVVPRIWSFFLIDAASPPSHSADVCLSAPQNTAMASAPRRTPQMVGELEEPPVRYVCACVHANGVVTVGTNVVVRVCVVIWPAHAAFALTWIAMIYVRFHRCPYACRRCQAR